MERRKGREFDAACSDIRNSQDDDRTVNVLKRIARNVQKVTGSEASDQKETDEACHKQCEVKNDVHAGLSDQSARLLVQENTEHKGQDEECVAKTVEPSEERSNENNYRDLDLSLLLPEPIIIEQQTISLSDINDDEYLLNFPLPPLPNDEPEEPKPPKVLPPPPPPEAFSLHVEPEKPPDLHINDEKTIVRSVHNRIFKNGESHPNMPDFIWKRDHWELSDFLIRYQPLSNNFRIIHGNNNYLSKTTQVEGKVLHDLPACGSCVFQSILAGRAYSSRKAVDQNDIQPIIKMKFVQSMIVDGVIIFDKIINDIKVKKYLDLHLSHLCGFEHIPCEDPPYDDIPCVHTILVVHSHHGFNGKKKNQNKRRKTTMEKHESKLHRETKRKSLDTTKPSKRATNKQRFVYGQPGKKKGIRAKIPTPISYKLIPPSNRVYHRKPYMVENPETLKSALIRPDKKKPIFDFYPPITPKVKSFLDIKFEKKIKDLNAITGYVTEDETPYFNLRLVTKIEPFEPSNYQKERTLNKFPYYESTPGTHYFDFTDGPWVKVTFHDDSSSFFIRRHIPESPIILFDGEIFHKATIKPFSSITSFLVPKKAPYLYRGLTHCYGKISNFNQFCQRIYEYIESAGIRFPRDNKGNIVNTSIFTRYVPPFLADSFVLPESVGHSFNFYGLVPKAKAPDINFVTDIDFIYAPKLVNGVKRQVPFFYNEHSEKLSEYQAFIEAPEKYTLTLPHHGARNYPVVSIAKGPILPEGERPAKFVGYKVPYNVVIRQITHFETREVLSQAYDYLCARINPDSTIEYVNQLYVFYNDMDCSDHIKSTYRFNTIRAAMFQVKRLAEAAAPLLPTSLLTNVIKPFIYIFKDRVYQPPEKKDAVYTDKVHFCGRPFRNSLEFPVSKKVKKNFHIQVRNKPRTKSKPTFHFYTFDPSLFTGIYYDRNNVINHVHAILHRNLVYHDSFHLDLTVEFIKLYKKMIRKDSSVSVLEFNEENCLNYVNSRHWTSARKKLWIKNMMSVSENMNIDVINEDMTKKAYDHDFFLKDESYLKYKAPRGIQNAQPLLKCLHACTMQHLNDVFFSLPCTVKHIPLNDRPEYLRDYMSGYSYFYGFDFTSWECSITAEVIKAFADFILLFPKSKMLYSSLMLQSSRHAKIKNDYLKAKVPLIRMSGDFETSFGNSVINWCLIKHYARINCIKCKVVVEGDDAIVATNKPLPGDIVDFYKSNGFDLELVDGEGELGKVGFCSTLFDDNGLYKNPEKLYRSLLSNTFTGLKREDLQAAKVSSADYTYPNNPVIHKLFEFVKDLGYMLVKVDAYNDDFDESLSGSYGLKKHVRSQSSDLASYMIRHNVDLTYVLQATNPTMLLERALIAHGCEPIEDLGHDGINVTGEKLTKAPRLSHVLKHLK